MSTVHATPALVLSLTLTLAGCTSVGLMKAPPAEVAKRQVPVPRELVGSYSAGASINSDKNPANVLGGLHDMYTLSLRDDGTFQAHHHFVYNGTPVTDSTLHVGGYGPHELLSGSWEIAGDALVLHGSRAEYKAQLRPSPEGWYIDWDNLLYFKDPNRPSGTDALNRQ